MTNERLDADAHRFVELSKKVAEARTQHNRWDTELRNGVAALDKLSAKMKEHVGRNVPHRIARVAGGIIVTLEYRESPDEHVVVRAFGEDGEEIQ